MHSSLVNVAEEPATHPSIVTCWKFVMVHLILAEGLAGFVPAWDRLVSTLKETRCGSLSQVAVRTMALLDSKLCFSTGMICRVREAGERW